MNPIRNAKEYQEAFERLELIFDTKKGTDGGDEIEVLSDFIDEY